MSQIRTSLIDLLPILFMLVAVAGMGMSTLIWLAPVPAGDITPAQDRLMNIADWMVKAAIGAIIGYSGARLAARSGSQTA